MDTVERTPEVRPHWLEILREQGRTMTWLSIKTETSYAKIAKYATGGRQPRQEWLDRVSELLGVPVK